MKTMPYTWRQILAIALIITGCSPATAEDITPTLPPTNTNSPATAPSSLPVTEMPTLVPVTDPSIEVGSIYLYVDGSNLVAIPEGEFLMGGGDSDNPEHRVLVSDFWIYSTEVTNQQYLLCESMGKCTSPDPGDNPSYADKPHANDPVVGVTYEQAVAYCGFVNGRLPTEAEWEKSARNTAGDLYPWGDTVPTCDLLNFDNCVGNTTNVVDYHNGASIFGALDMSGNAFEWVADWFDANYYDNSPGDNPQGPASGTMRSVRSSSYASDVSQVTVTIRSAEDPLNHRPDLGFRCVVEEPTYFAPFCEAPFLYESLALNTTSSELCPTLEIAQAQFCVGKLPATNVRFRGPSDSTIDSSTCIPSDDPKLFTCQTPGTIVSISADCQLQESGNPACPSGFSQMGNVCIADGGSGQCLAGDYDSSKGCCVVPDEPVAELSISSICPVGTFYAIGENACLPYPVQGIVTISLDVGFTSCNIVNSGGGGGNGGGGEETCCEEPTGGCGISTFWDPVQCCCSVDGITCDYKPSCP